VQSLGWCWGVQRGTGATFQAAQQQWHDGTVAAKGRRRKRAAHSEGCSFYIHRRRLANGGAGGRVAMKSGVVERWRPRSKRGWHGGAVVRTV
jgi:hypothetical protein